MTRATTGRRTRVADPTWYRLMLAGAVVLGVVATVLVVVSEEARWLRLAVLAALWAGLMAAFAVARARREAKIAELRQEEGKRTYELELQREVTARREYEAKVLEHARQESDDRHREELSALREQVERLSETLSGLLDGDLLVERLTLSAESTRVRQIGGDRTRMVPPTTSNPFPGRLIGPPLPPADRRPAPPRSEDDTVQLDRGSLTQHARSMPGRPEPVVVDAAAARPRPTAPAQPSTEAPTPAPEPEVAPKPAGPAAAPKAAEPAAAAPKPAEPVAAAPKADQPKPAVPEQPKAAAAPTVVTPTRPVAVEPTVGVEDETPVAETAGAEPVVPESTEPAATGSEAAQPAAADTVSAAAGRSTGATGRSATAVVDAPVAAEVQDESPAPEPTPEREPDSHHSAGVSVSDLLAAYGRSPENRPRRRRAADD